MTDVLLAHSFFLKYDPKQLARMKPYPPLATLYVASVLRKAGYSVALFDATFAESEAEFAALVIHLRPRYVVLYEDSFNFLIKMCLARMRDAAHRMSAMASEHGATVVAAGPDVTDRPALYFRHGVQYALIGEAEHTLLELLTALDVEREPSVHDSTHVASERIHAIPGLAWPDPDEPNGIGRSASREPERCLDRFPFPAWDMLDVERYRHAWKQAHGYFSLNMVTTRGCPFQCNWCAKPIWGQRYAIRSPANVAEEMALVRQTLDPDHLWFADDIFGLRGPWVAEFGEEVAARGAQIPFMIQSRVDLMTERTVNGLAQAGCQEVWLGAESGSQKILDAMDKGTRVQQIGPARARLQEAGIRACFFIQFGYPGETFDDIMATVRMVRETLPDDIGISVSYPLPGTRFYDLVREQIGAQTNWQDSGDLAMMFQGAYTSSFYRHLHRLLHQDLDVRRRLLQVAADGDAIAALDRLTEAWYEMGQLESMCRSEAPTAICLSETRPVAPALDRDWN